MKANLQAILANIPRAFMVLPRSDYSRFVVKGGASQLMRENWSQTGKRLQDAMRKVSKEIDERQTHA